MKVILLFVFIALVFTQKEAVRITQPLIIDGVLEKQWSNGVVINEFQQFSPTIYGETRYETNIHILYDDDYLYIGGKVWQPKSELVTNRYRRDSFETWKSDFIQLMFSTGESSVNAYFVTINPSNSKNDGIFNEQTEENLNLDINSISEVSVFNDRWEFEVKIPLSEIDYQDKASQRWMFSFIRHFALHSERAVSHRYKKDNIFEINSFEPISGFKNLGKSKHYTTTAYQYYQFQKDNVKDVNTETDLRGYDINYQPNGASRLLLTINPDFAQLESDEPIINVGDEPTNYPEKRSFFTSGTGMYNDQTTIRTRNIGAVDVGMKWIQDINKLEYDFTVVQDKEHDRWMLSDIIYTDDKTYRYELVNGFKEKNSKVFHNSRLNLDRYFFNKRLKLINQLEYTRSDQKGYGNTFNLIYQTREWLFSYQNQIKTKDYDTGEIGFKEISNKSNHFLQIRYNMFFTNSWLIFLKPEINIEDLGLHEGSKKRSRMFDIKLHSLFSMGRTFGVWYFGARYQPEISQSFRHRHSLGENYDNYSNFDLKDSSSNKFVSWLGSDKSKFLAFDLEFGHSSVRAARSHFQTLTLFLTPHENFGLSYKLDRIDIGKSDFQTKLTAVTHRIKLDYNITDKMNLRTIYNLSKDDLPLLSIGNNLKGIEQKTPNLNMTFSWEYSTGSFIYIMYNDYRSEEKIAHFNFEQLADTKSFVLKINKTFNF